jgi:hypothetical protein
VLACALAAFASTTALPGVQLGAQSLPPAPADPLSLNPVFRTLALSQGIVVGSPEWVGGGLESFSGATGSHAAYGWRHDHLLTAAWARAVISNYAARPGFYQAAPARESGYYIGSRPNGWVMDEPNSNPDGSQNVGTEEVSGPDLEHFPLSPLFTVARSSGLVVTTPSGGLAPADLVARTMIRYLMADHAGMMRKSDGSLSAYVCSDRAARYFVGNLAEAIQLGCIDPADAATMNDYVRQRLLPHWTALPDNDSAKGGDLQIYNGVCWAVPALYELLLVTPPGPYRQEIFAALKVQCSKLALFVALVPGHACEIDNVKTWYGLTPSGITIIDFEGPWEIRSMLVAGIVLGLPACTNEAMTELSHWVNDKSQLAWLVDPAGNYLVPWSPP